MARKATADLSSPLSHSNGKKNKNKNKGPKLRITVRHALTNIYVVLMFTLFPLFLSNRFNAARRDKFWFLVILTAIIGVSVGILTLTDYFTRNSPYSPRLHTHHDPLKITPTDIAFSAFFLVSVISTFLSYNIKHSFIGLTTGISDGRNMGLLTIMLLFAAYLIISRFFFYQKWIIYCAFAAMAIVAVLAVLNYYYIDPLNYFDYYKTTKSYHSTLMNFTSTIGNKNYLSAFICISLPLSVGMAIASEDYIMRIVSYVSTGIQFMGLIVATSDGGFLGLGALLLTLLVVLSRKPEKLKRMFMALTVMVFSAQLLRLFDFLMKGNSKGYSSFSELFLKNKYMPVVLLFLAAVTVGIHFIHQAQGDELLPKYVFYVALGLVGLVVLALISLFIQYTYIDKESTLTGFMRFFRFDEYWGTHRGYFWIRSVDIFKNDLTFSQQLFGTGPDSFYNTFKPYFSELVTFTGGNEGSTNAAHNVYINYLITHGVLGLGAYLALVGSSIVLSIKRARTNPLALVALCAIVTYATQDIINIANPVNTPWFIMFIALSEATELKANSEERLKAINF